MSAFTRRDFLKASVGTCALFGASGIINSVPKLSAATSTVHAILGDQLSDLYQMAGNAAQAIGIESGNSLSGHTVFIKPNLVCMGMGSYVPLSGQCTKAEIVIGVAEQCLLAGADKVTIGEAAQGISWDWSTVSFIDGNTIFGTTNLQDAASHLQMNFPSQTIELSCLHEVNEWEYLPSSSTEEMLALGLKVGKSFYDADHLITIAPIKTHGGADISCAMKNLVGVIPAFPPYGLIPTDTWMMRDQLHKAYAYTTSGGVENAGIEAAFTDIIKWRKDNGNQDFAIMDCSIGVEGAGPHPFPYGSGKTIDIKARSNIEKYYLLASNDIAAVDATNIRIMNQDVETIRQLVIARNLGLGEITDIGLTGAAIEDLLIPDWLMASQNEEWGLASTVPADLHGSHTRYRSQMVNTMAGLTLPAAMVGGLRAWHQRKQACCSRRGPADNPVEQE